MTVKTVIDILMADSSVTQIIGSGDDAKITPIVRTQDAGLPAVAVTSVAVNPVNLLNGTSGMDENRVQVDSWASSYEGSRALAQACRAAIEASGSLMMSELDNFDASAELSGEYCVTQEFSVWT